MIFAFHRVALVPQKSIIDRIDRKGALVTIDAMGCQKEMAQTIIDAQGDYVLAVKDNQPKWHEAIQEVFRDRRQGDLVKRPHRQHPTTDNSHGRKDERYDVVTRQ